MSCSYGSTTIYGFEVTDVPCGTFLRFLSATSKRMALLAAKEQEKLQESVEDMEAAPEDYEGTIEDCLVELDVRAAVVKAASSEMGVKIDWIYNADPDYETVEYIGIAPKMSWEMSPKEQAIRDRDDADRILSELARELGVENPEMDYNTCYYYG